MSQNHYYSSERITEPRFDWPQLSPSQNPPLFSRLMTKPANFCAEKRGGGSGSMFNLNRVKHEEEMTPDHEQIMLNSGRDSKSNTSSLYLENRRKEHLFEKPLTPSDVGKLNRLVIPKQHAEKYFPLSGGDSGEKGFLLSFEDEVGKPWKFRYSYWNSSQSYVLTKGWSRFVKEKRLYAGDFVLFSRHLADAGRLFIGWRRRHSGVEGGGTQPVAGREIFYNIPYPNQQVQGCSTSPSHQSECLHSAPTSGNWKKLRLFGVNLECQADKSDSSTVAPADGGSSISVAGPRWLGPYHHQYNVVHNPHTVFN